MSINKCDMCGHEMTVGEIEKENPLWATMDIIHLNCPECGKFHVMAGDTMRQLGVSNGSSDKS